MFETISNMVNYAQPNQTGVAERLGSVGSISGMIVNIVIGVGFSISLVAIALSAVMHVLSGGDPDKTKRAWNAFLYGAIGAAFSLGIVALKNIVIRAFGIDDPNIINGPPTP